MADNWACPSCGGASGWGYSGCSNPECRQRRESRERERDKHAGDPWANFLAAEKLTAGRVTDPRLAYLIACLSNRGTPPRFKPHAARIASRLLVAQCAMDVGIDLAGWRHRGKLAMGAGLLAVWNREYARRYGSAHGTAGSKEAQRRAAKSVTTNRR